MSDDGIVIVVLTSLSLFLAISVILVILTAT